MTPQKQQQANQRNAKKSTGPKSQTGREIVSRNAIKHNAFSECPVIPDFGMEEDWESHLNGMLQSLAPKGRLEMCLAERIALLLWRLDRLTRYEANIIRIRVEEATEPVFLEQLTYFDRRAEEEKPENQLPKEEDALRTAIENLNDHELGLSVLTKLQSSSIPKKISSGTAYTILQTAIEWVDESRPGSNLDCLPCADEDEFLCEIGIAMGDSFTDIEWTAELITKGFEYIAGVAEFTMERLVEVTLRELKRDKARHEREVTERQRTVEELRKQAEVSNYRKRARRSIPLEETENRIIRCESHLNRQLFQTLHELQRIQAARAGEAVPVPAAVEVGVNVQEGAA